jgi:formylglycine-generating enzyme required for sulfatase activity
MPQDSVRRLPRGSYWIGDDTSANAAPRHRRTFVEDVWIDSRLASWSDFERFVVSEGYSRLPLWHADGGISFPESCLPLSVDERCEQVRALTLAGQESGRTRYRPTREWPVLGLTWFECVALCRSLDARLPYEAEWEAAMAARLIAPADSTNVFQEWTADAYVNRYWRVDERIRGNDWDADDEVVVRGYSQSEPAMAVTARRAVSPSAAALDRGFRFVWPNAPIKGAITPF